MSENNTSDASDLPGMKRAANESAEQAGARPSIVKHFSIEGLYGYRTLSLQSDYAATIVIARNGSGKTTLLSALDAFLRAQFNRFAELEFETIRCTLEGVERELCVRKADVDTLMKQQEQAAFSLAAKFYEIEPTTLMELAFEDLNALSVRELLDNPFFYKIYAKSGYSTEKAKQVLSKIQADFYVPVPELAGIKNAISESLSAYEVVYLPTFRRVELSLPTAEDPRTGRRKLSLLARLGMSKRGLYAGDMQFGLADISDRLARLNQEMVFDSNRGYQEISANIIDDLITGAFERENPNLDERPSQEALSLFFARIKEGRSRFDTFERAALPDLSRIYSGNVPIASAKFLNYFLGKLNTVMAKTRNVEQLVEEFIKSCNRYLSEGLAEDSTGGDSKFLRLDLRTLNVQVYSSTTKRKVPLDALSSGEKQMISLFARLYLYPGKKKIVLIDEPELSLSLDWQRTILVDILRAESCSQVVAITHSPFVFDNELDAFATTLKLRIDQSKAMADGDEDTNV